MNPERRRVPSNVIAILSSNTRERTAFVSLCENHGWPAIECDSLRQFRRLLLRTPPRVILTRHKLDDGYSDDVMALLTESGQSESTKVVVLMTAGTAATQEARQILLGASAVQRDPIRTEVVSAYLSQFRRAGSAVPAQRNPAILKAQAFAGTTIQVVERTLRYAGKSIGLTPREMELIQILQESRGAVVTYDTLYSEILGRRFRGDTSNMRVLLGKLDRSFRAVGGNFRRHIEVIPKTGFRYRASASS